MTTVIYICGIYNLLFALFHAGFWKLFDWGAELKKLQPVNGAIMQVLNIQLMICFLAVAFICARFPAELTGTGIGRVFMIVCSLFWLIRAVNQLVFFSASLPLSWMLTVIFLIGAVLFALPVLRA
jgi:hypothetical protein